MFLPPHIVAILEGAIAAFLGQLLWQIAVVTVKWLYQVLTQSNDSGGRLR